uniref:Uncharacterized protein n=1 Tax=Parascaris equorum TaxID=6256 RepID=A0A914S3Q3_PAREQ
MCGIYAIFAKFGWISVSMGITTITDSHNYSYYTDPQTSRTACRYDKVE